MKQILILTKRQESSVKLVIPYLKERNQKFLLLYTEDFPIRDLLTINHTDVGCSFKISSFGSKAFASNSFKSVWYRQPGYPQTAKDIHEDIKKFVENESRAVLWTLYNIIDAAWINRPLIATKLLEDNKLYQLKIANSIGIKTPASLISNSPKEILNFIESNNGSVAIKPIFSTAFIDENNKTLLVYTNKITLEQAKKKENDLKLCPVFLQEYIEKDIELRVTIVGKQIFTCAIHSQQSLRTLHDWRRYDFKNVKHEQYTLPSAVEMKLLSLMDKLGLYYGAIDMILTPSGEFVFLEINPNGQWSWIEGLTGMKISKSIAELLCSFV